MNAKKGLNAVFAAVLGFMLALSAVACPISGFELKIEQVPLLVMVTALFSIIGAVVFSFRYGSYVMLGIVGLSSLIFWQGGAAQMQTQALLTRISYSYDHAYQCGILRFSGPWYGVKADLPMMMLSCIIVLAVTWVICRRKSVVFALIPPFIPLISCLILNDTVPNKYAFFFFLVGILVLLITAYVRRRDPAHTHVLTGIAVVAVTAAVAVLFTAVPQAGYRNPFEVYQNQLLTALGIEGYGRGGSGEYEVKGIDLKGLGSRFFLQYPVMTVTSSESGVLYLRERDYNLYDGYKWESDDKRIDRFRPYSEGINGYVRIQTEWYRTQKLVPYHVEEPLLFSDGREWNDEQALDYDWTTWRLPDDWRSLVPNEPVEMIDSSDARTRYYHSLPLETQAWAQDLLADILTDEQSATAIADTVANYVRNSAVYEDDCERMPSRETDFAKWFIESAESGYCIHFATATAVLLRAAGVHTRYVNGYMVETVANEPVVVTADLEHAWVEYYEPALGLWIPLESTPAEPEDTQEEETTTPPTTTTHSGETTPTKPTVTRPTRPEEGGSGIAWGTIFKRVGSVLLVLGAIAGVIALVIGQRRFRKRRRQRRWDQSTANGRALTLWRDASRMRRFVGGDMPEALYELAQKAKYSQHTLSEEELQLFREECEALEARLRGAPWYARLVYRYILMLY